MLCSREVLRRSMIERKTGVILNFSSGAGWKGMARKSHYSTAKAALRTLTKVVAKEVEEETGIEVEVERLIAVLDGLRIGMTRIPLYSLVFQCRPIGGTLRAHPLECADVGWFPLDNLPQPLAGACPASRSRCSTITCDSPSGEATPKVRDPRRLAFSAGRGDGTGSGQVQEPASSRAGMTRCPQP